MQFSLRYLLHLAYCGTDYRGWQRQPDVRSVQESLEQQLSNSYNCEVKLHGCGRTDAEVHALQFFCHVDLPSPYQSDLLNPPGGDIQIYDCWPVAVDFHAQRDAVERSYSYLMHFDDRQGWNKRSSRFYPGDLNVELLQICAERLVGNHDFRGLCRQPDIYRSTNCNISKSHWKIFDDGVYRFDISGNRFLRGMVRILVQRMWEVAQGKLSMSEWEQLLRGAKLKSSLRSAYPDGLYLSAVSYENRVVSVVRNRELFGDVIDYLDC